MGRQSAKDKAAMALYEEWEENENFHLCPRCGVRQFVNGESSRWATSATSFEDMGANGLVLDESNWRRPTWEIWKTFGASVVSPGGFEGLRCETCGHEWAALGNICPHL